MGMVEKLARALADYYVLGSPDKHLWERFIPQSVKLLEPTPEMLEAGRSCYNGMRTPSCEEVWAAMCAAIK